MPNLPHATWLRAFEAAARHGSFAMAADELGLTPAAVSQQIRLLEKKLGERLFKRLPRGVELTDLGQAYALPLRKAFADMQSATDGLFEPKGKKVIRLRASISYATLCLAPRLNSFNALHPNIEVHLSTTVWSDRMDDFDLDIRYGRGNWNDAHCWRLGHETAHIVCHPDHLSRFDPNPKLEDMAADRVIQVIGSEVEWDRLETHFKLNLPPAEYVTRADSSLVALQILQGQSGMALILESFTQAYLANGTLVSPFELRLPVEDAYYLIAAQQSALRPEVQTFRKWLTQHAA